MSTQISEQSIRALFDAAETPLDDAGFTHRVLSGAEQLKRRLWIRRGLIGVAVFLASIPFEEFIIAVSQMLLVSLVEMPAGVASQLLAPVNSVGGLLSAVLLGMRVAHRKLFHR